MPIIIDQDEIKRLRRKRRPKRLKLGRPETKLERELFKRMNDLWVRVLFPATDQIKKMIEQGAGPADIAEVVEQVLRTAEYTYNIAVNDIVTRWKMSVDMDTRRAIHHGLKDSLGVDIAAFVDDPVVSEALAVGGMQAANLIKSIPSVYLGQVAQAVADNFTGRPLPERRSLIEQIQHLGGVTESRAKLIARDQTSKIVSMVNQSRQRSIGIDQYIWKTVKDERVVGKPGGAYPSGGRGHGNHYKMHGLLCRWDDPTVYSKDKGETWISRTGDMPKAHPGEEIQCFLGHTEVNFSDGCYKLYRRLYTGEFTSIVTGDGGVLEATPNHPILTTRGWLAINEVQEGDYLIKRTSNSVDINTNTNKFVASFEDMFNASKVIGVSETIGSSSDFHGDGSEGQVDIINIERFLSSHDMSTSFKGFGNLFLAWAKTVPPMYPIMLSLESCFTSRSFSAFFGSVPGRFMRLFSVLFSFLWASPRHTNVPTFRHSSHSNPILQEDTFYGSVGHIKFFSKCIHALTRIVKTDYLLLRKIIDSIMPTRNPSFDIDAPGFEVLAEIVRVTPELTGCVLDSGPFRYELCRVVKKTVRVLSDCHVYNLQAKNNYYIADNFIVSNCRCHAEPVLNIEKILAHARTL